MTNIRCRVQSLVRLKDPLSSLRLTIVTSTLDSGLHIIILVNDACMMRAQLMYSIYYAHVEVDNKTV